jgi:hypothetical protein
MNKNRKSIFGHILALFSSHTWLKFIALLLAVVIWFYVRGEGI